MSATTNAVRRAVVDVGTNSVKVLVGDVAGGDVIPVWETSAQTRLGRGFYETRRLLPEPIAATAMAVARFSAEARTRGAVSVRVVATSAARDALNRADLVDAIQRASGLRVEVISGDVEAAWGFRGVTSAPGLGGRRLLILDVGGGSTEFVLGRADACEFRRSFALGSVRLMERFPAADPPGAGQLDALRAWLDAFLRAEVAPGLVPCLGAGGVPEHVLGVGGTTAILALIQLGSAEFDRPAIESTVFSAPDLGRLVERLWSLPLGGRRALPGLPPERADVILFGAAIYESVIRVFGFSNLGVSLRGLRFAALLDGPGAGEATHA